MVRVFERTKKEQELLEKRAKLKDITRKLVSDKDIHVQPEGFSLYNNSILVILPTNRVIVAVPERLQLAIELAAEYERKSNEEFAVKKDYFVN